jgi:hypothetical protein
LTEPVTVMISAGFLLAFSVFAWVFMPNIRNQE